MHWRRTICIGFALGVAACVILYFAGGYATRHRNMRLADVHRAAIEPRLAADTRFVKVSLGTDYRGPGGITVGGEVGSSADWLELERIIDASNPPVRVIYSNMTVGGRKHVGVVFSPAEALGH